MDKSLKYYSSFSRLTDLSKYSDQVKSFSNDPKELARIVQGLIVHSMWLDRYGIKESNDHVCQQQTSSMQDLLDLAMAIENKPIDEARQPEQKVIACCREYSVMLCALLRAKEIPARARCGFATYLAKEGYYEDHWICEMWNGTDWQKIDPQIDDFQLNSIRSWAKDHPEVNAEYRNILLDLDPMNIKEGDFMIAGKAWQMCRSGKADPSHFGISCDPRSYGLTTLYGLWFVRGNLIRDFLALNKIELVPYLVGLERRLNYWDTWRLMSAKDEELTEQDYKLLDRMAELTLNPDSDLDEIQKVYIESRDLTPSKDIFEQ